VSDHDPRPWLEAGSDAPPGMRDALEAARGARPAPDQLARLAGRLTVTLGVPVPAAAAAPPPVWWAAPGLKLASVVLLVGGAGAVAAGIGGAREEPRRAEVGVEMRAVAMASSSSLDDAPPAASVVVTPEPTSAPPVLRASPGVPSATSRGAPATSPNGTPADGPLAPSVTPGSSSRSPSVGEEMAMLDRAQQALRPRPAEALALAEEHAQRFAGGKLAEEREVIAVGALLRLGRRGEAEQRAQRFRASFPRSAYAPRMQQLLDE
jgi:hypothetical protein